jgi:hypothetical protein
MLATEPIAVASLLLVGIAGTVWWSRLAIQSVREDPIRIGSIAVILLLIPVFFVFLVIFIEAFLSVRSGSGQFNVTALVMILVFAINTIFLRLGFRDLGIACLSANVLLLFFIVYPFPDRHYETRAIVDQVKSDFDSLEAGIQTYRSSIEVQDGTPENQSVQPVDEGVED